MFHRPTLLDADRVLQGEKYGKYHFHISQYALAHDLLSGDSRLRTVTAIFRGKAFSETAFLIDTNMSTLKSMLFCQLPKEALGSAAEVYFEKNMSLTIDGVKVGDDEMFGLCTWKRGKVASSDEKEKIIIHVYVSEGMTGLSSGSNGATNSKDG